MTFDSFRLCNVLFARMLAFVLFACAFTVFASGCSQPDGATTGQNSALETEDQTGNGSPDASAVGESVPATTTTNRSSIESELPPETGEPLVAEPGAEVPAAPENTALENNATETVAPAATQVTPANYQGKFLMWNVESEGADGSVIAEQLSELSGYDLYALTEVLLNDVDRFEMACGENFKSIFTQSGNNDRMMIIYNADKLELLRFEELDDINIKRRYRSPLLAQLKDKTSGTEFLVVVNHLARGKEEIRQQQAGMLVEWARAQSMPVIALGDYNFDYVFSTENGNEAFKIFMRDGIFSWLKPDVMVDTNWYDPEGDGIDNYPGSMLDFAFVAQQAMDWDCKFNVVVRDGDFPDDETTSDHRPCEVIVNAK